jgi:tetratricopeptide (TPR) repeat protein
LTHPRTNPFTGIPRLVLSVVLSLVLLASVLMADVRKLVVDKNTPEGQFLELVALEGSSAKKLGLLEQFLVLFPNADPKVMAWVCGELQDRYRRGGKLAEAIAVGEKLLALEPDNIDIARLNWSLAETKGDAELVKKWTTETAKIADRIVKMPLPSEPEDKKAAEEHLLFARQFVVNTDYDDYTKAIATKDPAGRIAALEEFVKKSPQNPYLDQIEIAEFLAFKESGDVEKTLAAAERILAHNEGYENALLYIAEVNSRRKTAPARTLALASKFVQRMAVAVKPDGMTDQEWTHYKTHNLALAHYMIAAIHFENEQWAAADQALRAALPLIGEEQFRATVLNQLGWANYRLRSPIDAIRFYSLCAAIPGPLQEQASKTIASIKREYALP